jgi:hypothetical protein
MLLQYFYEELKSTFYVESLFQGNITPKVCCHAARIS